MKPWTLIHRYLGQGQSCALITVAKVTGSAPREAGAQMIVLSEGQYHGTIGGGTLEWEAIRSAQQSLTDRNQSSAGISKHVLGPDLGQCCGGVVYLLTETWLPHQAAEVATIAAIETAEPGDTLSTTHSGGFKTCGTITSTGVRRQRIDSDPASTADTGTSDDTYPKLVIDKPGDSFIIEQHRQHQHPVYVFGAGHVGRALILALASLPFSVVWIDEREDAFPTHLPTNVQPIQTPNPVHALAQAPETAFVLVMTHSHQRDLELTGYALQADRFDYVGLIGSQSKRGRFVNRWRRLWLAQGACANTIRQRIEHLTCPIGIAGITGKHPASIAAATTAQLLQCLETNVRADRFNAPAESLRTT